MRVHNAHFLLLHFAVLRPDNFHIKRPAPRAVELAEEHRLPRSEQQPAFCDDDTLTASRRRGFQVRGGITLHVAEFRAVGVSFVETEKHITHDVGVGVFVYGDSRCGMRAESHAYSFVYTAFPECLVKAFGYVGKALFLGA